MNIKPEYEIELIDKTLEEVDTIISLIPSIDIKLGSLNKKLIRALDLKKINSNARFLESQLLDYKKQLEKINNEISSEE